MFNIDEVAARREYEALLKRNHKGVERLLLYRLQKWVDLLEAERKLEKKYKKSLSK